MTPTLTWDQAEKGLAAHWGSFQPRPQQRAFAHAVTETLHGNSKYSVRLAQAGVGCGKSLGYLTPAVASGRRTVVAVSTKALQDQLFTKDLPLLAETLFPGLRYAVLKGRSNYVCLRAADKSSARAEVAPGSQGERSDLVVPATDEQWREMSTDAEGCIGRKACPFSDQCYSELAKQRAQGAQVLVVNSSLLTQDLRLRAMTRGAATLLGDFDQLIVDEAHEMADIVAGGLSTQLTLRRVMDTVSKLAYHLDGSDVPSQVETTVSLASRYFSGLKSWFDTNRDTQTADLDDDDRIEVGKIVEALQPLADLVSRAMCSCEPVVDPETGEEDLKCEHARRVSSLTADLVRFATPAAESADVVWTECVGRSGSPALKSSPAEVGGWLRTVLWEQMATAHGPRTVPAVLTSATLGVGGDFGYQARRLGIPAFDDIDVGTPFDYGNQALLYLPPASAPNPSKQRDRWLVWAREQMQRLIAASDGGALILFTGTAAMNDAYQQLADFCRTNDWQPLVQGGGVSNRDLAEEFARVRKSVLFATRSFMTGVDFVGNTCQLVIVDKMPFPVPSDPVFKARCKAVEDRFGERAGFSRVSIPEMSTVLNQAVGRLIRSVDDRGVVAILDSRMRAGWAGKIRRSLPPIPVCDSIDDVDEFYLRLAAEVR